MLLAFDYQVFDGEVSTSELREWREAATKDEPSMHVKVTPRGEWHRMLVDRSRTACGRVLGAYATRDESYSGRLCEDGCFSPYEMKLAIDLRVTEALDERTRIEVAERESKLTKEIAESRAENRRRLDIATGRHRKLDPEDK